LVRGFYQVILRAPDLEAARAFYGDILGLEIEHETPALLVLKSEGSQGALLSVGIGEASATGAEVWWRVDDADAFRAALVAGGVRIIQEPTDLPFGRVVAFADPAGNALHVFQRPR
jgi:predicted enzyme related to lactoylglutathione lyase